MKTLTALGWKALLFSSEMTHVILYPTDEMHAGSLESCNNDDAETKNT